VRCWHGSWLLARERSTGSNKNGGHRMCKASKCQTVPEASREDEGRQVFQIVRPWFWGLAGLDFSPNFVYFFCSSWASDC
jgi:hypothetical protein